MYRDLLSKRASPCKHPLPIFDDPVVYIYMFLRVSAHPVFFFGPVNYKRLLRIIWFLQHVPGFRSAAELSPVKC